MLEHAARRGAAAGADAGRDAASSALAAVAVLSAEAAAAGEIAAARESLAKVRRARRKEDVPTNIVCLRTRAQCGVLLCIVR